MLVPYSCSVPYYLCLDVAPRQAVQFVSPTRLLPDRREGEERIESPIDSVDELELAAPFRDVFRQEMPKYVKEFVVVYKFIYLFTDVPVLSAPEVKTKALPTNLFQII